MRSGKRKAPQSKNDREAEYGLFITNTSTNTPNCQVGCGSVGPEQITPSSIGPEQLSASAYSSTEQKVGTYIDGSTIYRRVFTGTVSYSPNVRFSGTILTNAGINKIIKTEGYWVSGVNKIPIGSVFPTATGQAININMLVYVGGNNLQYVGTTGDSGSGDYEAVVYYTKTTS
ncbi:MAG: hypothetical protein EOM35_03945 [Negativicutes bacterium]|nr:hypothetical protein [Negativicutes bacterium]